MKMLTVVFWVVTPCGLAGRYKRFGDTYCLHLQGVTTQKTDMHVLNAMRTSNHFRDMLVSHGQGSIAPSPNPLAGRPPDC
jgi:hypothetical protein